LYNLKQRHLSGKPYTRTGDIVIACNPYQWFHDLYCESKRNYYARELVWDRQLFHNAGSGDDEGSGGGGGGGGGGCDARSRLEPHVYEVSSLAYRGLALEGDDQSILVSGESGAGKTETVKILLKDLASVQRGAHEDADDDTTFHSPIVQRVLDSNPLLEAFGNAKTVRNDNSSRFGKYIQLQFDAEDPVSAAMMGKSVPSCVLAGSKCEVYLLEKSRVVMHQPEERTYHVFYQLLAASDGVKSEFWDGLANTDNESFSYVGYTDTTVIEGLDDSQRFEQTLESLKLIGVEGDKLRELIRTLCVVLQLGNLVFEQDGSEGSVIDTSTDDLRGLSDLMGIDVPELVAALTIRTVRARNEEFKVPLNPEKAKDSCDAFAKEIYAKTFLWLVRTINDATCAELNYDGYIAGGMTAATDSRGHKRRDFGLIGMLDIFGFETFETNRFEQLCINYANEKLQQKFTHDIFRSVQAEYEYEGIELDEITYDDNTDVLDLVEGRMGLLAFLNEECVRPGGCDKGFVMKANAMNKESPCYFTRNSFEDVEFGVRHYAGPVVYDATNFVTKNMDTLPTDLQDCAGLSTNSIIANELSNESMMNPIHPPSPRGGGPSSPKAGATKKRRSPPATRKAPVHQNPKDPPKKKNSNLVGRTVWTKFKTQLTDLMTNLQKTRTRYIRCIKPNPSKLPLVMEHRSTVEQLRCAGVVAAVTISRSAFPNRLEHKIVLDRFKSLWEKGAHLVALEETNQSDDIMDDPDAIAGAMVSHLLTSAMKDLEVERDDGTVTKAFVIGRSRAYFRAGALEFLESERVKRLGVWAVEIQRLVRRFVARSRFVRLRTMSVDIQALARKRSARSRYMQWRSAAIVMECWYRCVSARLTLRELVRSYKATLIQTHWRMAVAITALKSQRRAAVVVQTMVRGALQRPKYRIAIHEKREEAKLENQVRALQRKLEEAEARRVEAEKMAEEKARRAVQEYREEKKDATRAEESAVSSVASFATPTQSAVASSSIASLASSNKSPPQSPTSRGQLSEQQQHLMDESGKMLEYLRKEVFKLRTQNSQMRTDLDLLKDNNQRLMDANASAGASFAALNQHTKHLSKANDKLTSDLQAYKQHVQKLNVTQVEIKEELKMKQATYVAEVHSRLQYQKALASIVDIVQDKCNDTRLVEAVLRIADACEEDYMSGPTGLDASSRLFSTPKNGGTRNGDSNSGLMSSIRNLWS